MTIQEQVKELNKIVDLLVRSKNKRLEKGKLTSAELDYQIECCRGAVKSLESLIKLREDVKTCLSTLNDFDFGLIQ